MKTTRTSTAQGARSAGARLASRGSASRGSAGRDSAGKGSERALQRAIVSCARAEGVAAPEGPLWKSGVYALLDSVFRARSRYPVVHGLLTEQLPSRLADRAALRFGDFTADVRALRGPEAYSRRVLNRQRIAGRRKTAVCCEVAARLSGLGLQTRRDLKRRAADEREDLVCGVLGEIQGFGPIVARSFLVQLEHAAPVRPDAVVRRFLAGLSQWSPDPRFPEDDERAGRVMARAAEILGLRPAHLDLWIHRRENRRSLPPARDGP